MMCTNCVEICVFILCIVLDVSSETTNATSSGICGQKATCRVYIDFAAEAIAKAKNSSVTCHDNAGECGQKEALMSYLEVADEMINKAKMNFPNSNDCNTLLPPIQDCSDLLLMGHKKSGVYTISPRNKLINNVAFEAYCDMETDEGGWTVIQRRGDFRNPVDYFYKGWKSYKDGFGDLEKEFWLGNDNIFALSNQEVYSARFDLEDVENNTRYANYDVFRIDDENSKYTLHISNYSGDAGDAMTYHSDQKFTTKDQDNNVVKGRNCAQEFKGSWWFRACINAVLNGRNLKRKKEASAQNKGSILWVNWTGWNESLARTEIKIRPKKFMSVR